MKENPKLLRPPTDRKMHGSSERDMKQARPMKHVDSQMRPGLPVSTSRDLKSTKKPARGAPDQFGNGRPTYTNVPVSPSNDQFLEDQILEAFHEQREAGISGTVRMVGLLLAPCHRPIVREEILPGLAYFHGRSGNHIDFYWPGYTGTMGNWTFDSEAFNIFRKSLEDRTDWKYSGEVELLLVNAYFHEHVRKGGSVTLDFSQSISFKLERAIEDKAIFSISSLFESIFAYAESTDGDDPTWGFSMTSTEGPVKVAWIDMVFSVIPLKLQKFWRATQPYRTINLSKGS